MTVTPERAREALERLVNSHFRNRAEHARISVPARPDHDDDLVLMAFIDQAPSASEMEALRVLRELGESATKGPFLRRVLTDAGLAYPETHPASAALRALLALLGEP